MPSMILIAEGENNTSQIVDIVASIEEANEMAANYLDCGPDLGWVAPWRFALVTRGAEGGWTKVSYLQPVSA